MEIDPGVFWGRAMQTISDTEDKDSVSLPLIGPECEAQNGLDAPHAQLQQKAQGTPACRSFVSDAAKATGVDTGDRAPAPGVLFDEINVEHGNNVKLYLIPDYLRDDSGNPVELNASKAIDVITSLNGGVRNGTEQEIIQSILKGEFKSGSYILARRADLERIVRTRETDPSLYRFNQTIASGSYNNSWCVSCTETLANTSCVRHVRLRDGNHGWYGKGEDRSRVVLLQGYICSSCSL